jgi:hypothetical protein
MADRPPTSTVSSPDALLAPVRSAAPRRHDRDTAVVRTGDALERLVEAQPVIVPDASLGDLRAAVAAVGCLREAGPGYPTAGFGGTQDGAARSAPG